ncbi:MAG: hypothetical protein GXP47_01560 [Acidobacteria bacterium]|nr:hypothetical protein [Acidobacteriota bacterium]
MDEILMEFLEEAAEALESLEAALGELENDPARAGARAYRSVHLLRGASGFLGLPRVARLAAAGETLFGRLESGVLPPAADRLEPARELHATLAQLIAAIGREGREPPGDDGPLVERLERAWGVG